MSPNIPKIGSSITDVLLLPLLLLISLGYNYIVNDDCYALHQRENGTNKIVADPQKYPNGMKNMTDALHADGLKVGIYS